MEKRQEKLPSDSELIAGIKAGGVLRQRLVAQIYQQYMGFVYKGQQRYKLNQEEARDAYGDAITGLCHQIQQDKFRGDSKLSTYLFKSFSNRCVDKLRRRASHAKVQWEDLTPTMPDKAKTMIQELVLKEETNRILDLMASLGEKCKKILIDSEYYGFNLQEIAERIGFKNAASVSSMKYRCLDKLKKLLAGK